MVRHHTLHPLAGNARLTDWLPQITLLRLRVAEAQITLRFYRTDSGRTEYEICEQQGTLHVIRQPRPWSATASAPERLRDILESFLPG